MLDRHAPDWDGLLEAFRRGAGRPVFLDQRHASRLAEEQPAEVAAVVAEAERLLAGERRYLGYPATNVGRVIDWNHDPIADYRWPAVPARRIDHRRAPSDPKWIWELNRLQHLPVLAQAWLFTGDDRFADEAFDQLDSWLDQNPIGVGIAWRGAFEAGIRAVSVAIALQGLRDSPALTTARYRRVVRMLDASARHCWNDRSRFSSANNHLIGELTGLVTVRLMFPELTVPAALSQSALDSIAAEAIRQILPDGAGAEQSVAYQIFTAELLVLVVVLGTLCGDRVPAELVDALDRSARYLVGLIGSDDPPPRYGDDDDSIALRLGAERKRTIRQHLGIVAATTGNGVAASQGETTMNSAWIAAALDVDVEAMGASVGHRIDEGMYARDGGLVVLRSGRRRVTMDVGPLGYLSIAAHGHADSLAVTMAVDGHDLIVDPGTASFYRRPEWRDVHRGTRAHPTVCVDGVDQSQIGGSFYWRQHATTSVNRVDLQSGIVDAEHDGYRRLDDPVGHRRWLVAPPGQAAVVVVDLLDGSLSHDVTVSWPLHPDLDVIRSSDGHVATRDGAMVLQLCYAATASIEVEQLRGDDVSHLGWWSDSLEVRTPAWLIGPRCRASLPLAFLSVLCPSNAVTIADPRIHQEGHMLFASWSEEGTPRQLVIDSSAGGAVVRAVAFAATSRSGEQ